MQSENSEPEWASVVGAGLAISALVSIALVASFGSDYFKSLLASAAPAWIQAIGTIVAILAAARIASTQIAATRSMEATRRREEDKKRILIVDALLRALESDVLTAEKHFRAHPSAPVNGYFVDRIQASSDIVAKIDPLSCPHFIVDSVLRLYPEPCGTLLEALREFKESFDDINDTYDRHAARLSNSFAVVKMMIAWSRKECAEALGSAQSE